MHGLVPPRWLERRSAGIGASIVAFGGLTAVLAPLLGEGQLVDVALLYLLLTLVASGIWGYRVGLATAVVANLLLNYFFVPPLHTFSVQQPENVVSLLVFLAVAAIGASMLAMLRRQVEVASAGEAEAGLLLDVSQAMGRESTPGEALTELCRTVTARLGTQRCIVLERDDGWRVAASSDEHSGTISAPESERADAAVHAGCITELRDAARTFIPFPSGGARTGVLMIVGRPLIPNRVDRERLLQALAAEASVALHRVQLAAEAQHATDLERTEVLRTAVLASVSHDLRSPLTAIKAAVSSLRDPDLHWSPGDTGGFLETIDAQTDRLTHVVTELLDMARLESGSSAIHLESIEVSLLLRDVMQATAAVTSGRPVTVEARNGVWTRSDYRLLMQALGNLVENAARYSVPGGAIRLCAEAGSDCVAISVKDQGPGIPEQDLPHVFEKFYRGVQSRRSPGTGLGLAIAKAMVDLIGGSISVRSSFKETVFTVRLPAEAAP